MWANQLLQPLASLLAFITLPLVWISTFVLEFLAQLTFGLILLPLSVVWMVCFFVPLLGTSWLWDRLPILRIPLAVVGLPLALLGSVYTALIPSMGDIHERAQKLNLCWGWPFSLDIFKLETGKALEAERRLRVQEILDDIELRAI